MKDSYKNEKRRHGNNDELTVNLLMYTHVLFHAFPPWHGLNCIGPKTFLDHVPETASGAVPMM